MRAVYEPFMQRWYVKGLGYFDSKADALIAIKNTTMSDTLIVRLSGETKQRLQEIATLNNVSLSDVARTILEKEVNGNGNE